MKRVGIVGTGLVGASIGLALTRDGVTVLGFDAVPGRADDAWRRTLDRDQQRGARDPGGAGGE